jgi:hypothetical protein
MAPQDLPVTKPNIARNSKTPTHQASHAQLPELHGSLKITTSTSQLQQNNAQLSARLQLASLFLIS